MKKIVIPLLVVALTLACVPTIPGFPPPAANTPGTETSLTPTIGVTPTAQSTATIASVSETPTQFVETPFASPTSTLTSPPAPDLTTTLVTATSGPANPTLTTAPVVLPGEASLTPTLGILTYGTLPPQVPYTKISLWNRSKREAYISLQVTMTDGKYSIIEYPVAGKFQISVPVGSYVYVAWVGGKKMVGTFRLRSSDSPTIILYKDKVVIQ